MGKSGLAEKQKGGCYYCSRPFSLPDCAPTVDHKIPTSRGGRGLPRNKVWACLDCNKSKGDMTEQEFRKWLELGKPYKKWYLTTLPERESWLQSKGIIRKKIYATNSQGKG